MKFVGRPVGRKLRVKSTPPLGLPRALGRMKAGRQNQTEAKYDHYLARRLMAGDVLWYRFEGIKFKLADNTHLTIDFALMRADGVLEMHDVKGARAIIEEDAKAKMKIAASMFPFVFKLAFPRKESEGGGWTWEDI